MRIVHEIIFFINQNKKTKTSIEQKYDVNGNIIE